MLFKYSFKNKVQNIKKNLKLHQVVVGRCTVNLNLCCWNIFDGIKVVSRSCVLMILKENSTPKF